MKTRTQGLTEREEKLVKLLVEECENTRDIQDKLPAHHIFPDLYSRRT